MTFHPNRVAQRGRFASMAIIVLFGALAGRFFAIQVLQHEQYALLSDQNRLNEVPLPAPRGIIYDRVGQIIAENIPGYTVSILAPRVDSLRAVLSRVGRRVALSRQEINLALRRHELNRNQPTLVFGDATFEKVSALEEHRIEFPGLIIQSSPKRFYPDSTAVSAFVGFTGEVTEADLANDSANVYRSGQQIGKQGLELQYESVLRGRDGSRYVEVDALQRVVRDAGVRAELKPVAAKPLRTHIDMELQRHVASLFTDSLRGAAVVLDPKTGAVLAIHSAPGYDPNRFIGRVSNEYYSSLQNDPRLPLYNKAMQGRYAPGSTWKLATAIMGLEHDVVRMEEVMPQRCNGGMQFGNRWFKCWKKEGHGAVDMRKAIEQSCDVYFYQLGTRLTLRNLVAGGRKLSFGERTGIDLPSEKVSDFPPVGPDSVLLAYYRAKFGQSWASIPAEALNMSIGQGSNAATVLSMARFYTALATDGHIARPHVVGDSVARRQIFNLSPEHFASLRTAMMGVVSAGGTAASAGIRGVNFAGKTGSAQNETPLDHAWFVGFAPAEDPTVVVAVMIEFGLHGYYAARLAKSIVEKFLHTRVSDVQVTGD